MKKFDEEKELDPLEEPEEDNSYKNTVELSDKGFSQETVSEMLKNEIKIRKLKLRAWIKEKREIKQFLRTNLLTKGTKEAK